MHTGYEMDPATQAVTPPIYRATTYHQADPWNPPLYDYARSGNPTRHAFEQAMADLEHGVKGFAFSSGMAALTAAFMLLSQGDHLIVTRDCQGGTQRVLRGVFSRFGIQVSYVDTEDFDALEEAVKPNTQAILVENFSNPFLHVTDMPRLAQWAHQHHLLVMVDNTFITPYLQNPLTQGADLVIHSATKMIGGHSDITAGVAVAKEEDLARRLYFIQNACGAILSPDDAYMSLRGLHTLPVRMDRAQDTAMQLAMALVTHPRVQRVYYPGLKTHPGHEVAKQTMRGFGQMLTIRLKDAGLVPELARHLRLARVGAGFGGTETIISLPELHCHAALTPEERYERQITPDVVRISVGLESAPDLLNDILGALDKAGS
ncbi:trans-sulfuration enzyme family protein [Sulfobacillus thermosulfidooxidans]|uniref:trans-sulfuration enzyme family protein n=1 Tax=Sulfobacillus thermosulfidooxidans TaxID=28034 RepID=UPI00178C9A92|nr:aminotransferase class I/II-fold pyridoxal phosphate-dependent enzyme [Sulfobacillus thermosulfidooxidans]